MKNLKQIAVTAAILFTAAPVSALTIGLGAETSAVASTSPASVKVSAAIEARISKGKDRASQEIDRRIKALEDLNTRVQAMIRLTADQKNSISATITAQVAALKELKTKITGDIELAVLKADITSITQAYRIYQLILPSGHILVAADKAVNAASDLNAFSVKLLARLNAAASTGKDVSALETKLSDMNAKINDAGTQANAAAALIVNISPDNGDDVKLKANAQALKNARDDIHAAVKDLVAARDDARAIVKGLAALHLETAASSSAAVTTQ